MTGLREQLGICLTGRVCLMGLGNTDYGDDGFGVRLAEELRAVFPSDGGPERAALPGEWRVVLAATSPERAIARVINEGFDQLVFLDAVEFAGAPGSVVFLDTRAVGARFPQISTHKISLGTLAQWAEANGATRAWLLGVQPESLRPGQPLTPTMRKSLEALAELLGGLGLQARAQPPTDVRRAREVNA